jgi:hypothetical protein
MADQPYSKAACLVRGVDVVAADPPPRVERE